jgi:beta-lactamase class A
VVWPPERAPVIVTVYLTGATVSADRQNAVIADVGRAVTTALA